MYDLILADPCWPYYGSKTKNAAAGKHYDLMTWEELAAMPVQGIANNPAMLLMWATGPLLYSQIGIMDQWGFNYRGVAFVWVKTRADGGIISGQGVPPTFVKPTTEFLLLGTTCKRGRPFPIQDSSMGQVVLAPREEHSKKPEVFQENIEKIVGPDVTKIELFARRQREGWDATGLELDGFDYREGNLLGLPF